MEIGDSFRRILHVVGSYPSLPLISVLVTEPLNLVAERHAVTTIDDGINDLVDLEFGFAIGLLRRGRVVNAAGNGGFGCGLEHGGVEDWVDMAIFIGQAEGDRVSAGAGDDLERAAILVRKLPGRAYHTEVLGLDISLFADAEVGCGRAAGIGVVALSLLRFGHGVVKSALNLVEVR